MNRNTIAHFSMAPQMEGERSTFNRSSSHKTTFNVGDIIPFYVDEVLPGDTFQVNTSKVVRLPSLITPVMDDIFLDSYYFFVPNIFNLLNIVFALHFPIWNCLDIISLLVTESFSPFNPRELNSL